MKSFIIKSSIFLFLVFGTLLAVFYRADGFSDPFYVRFTTPKQVALVIGNSRAAQGLMPSVLNRELNRNDVYNYAFTIGSSPYGPTYLESIKRKIATGSKDGIFVLTVDPWSIFTDSERPNDPQTFSEKNSFLKHTKTVNAKPNISYLVNSYDDMYIKILFNKSIMFLHDDGWLEVFINNYKTQINDKNDGRAVYIDSMTHKSKFETSVKRYINTSQTYNYSELRKKYLTKTIDYLKTKGEVYLVRLPVTNAMIDIENKMMHNFNEEMSVLSEKNNIEYFDLTFLNSKSIFNDAHHLNRESANFVSFQLAKMIKEAK